MDLFYDTYDKYDKYDTDKSDLEKKIPDARKLVKKTDFNVKVTKIESKIPIINSS